MPDNAARWRVAPVSGFTTLSLDLFLGGSAPAVNAYALAGEEKEPRLLASRATTIDRARLEEWRAAGLRGLMVRNSDLANLISEIEASLDCVLQDEALAPEERYRVMQCVVCSTLNERLRWAEVDRWVEESEQVADRLVNLIVGSDVAVESLFELAAHDTTTFVHATNCAAYAALLADELGEWTKEEVRQISVGAVLHDIGKRSLPQDILNKNGPLDPRERAIIQKHPTLGYEALFGQPNVVFGQLMMAYQHHEWINGGGYPVAIDETEIHPWAKLMAVVDVFDALTARRPYREGLTAGDALLKVTEGAGTQFDREVVRCWISVFERKSPTPTGMPPSTASTANC